MTDTPAPQANNYKDTLNLPKTSFDMKANLTQREPETVKRWQAANLYGQIREERKDAEKGKWVLHDGPPYANGDIHMGHLINKVLKDIVVKFRTMQGYDSPYVPGWDCHGLPIESAIQKELGPKFRELSKDEVRKRCQEYALKYVKLQGDSFQRLGILGSFDNPYLTLDPKYEAGILEVLAELVQRDLVYRQKKPVHWCTNDRTALAEAELEYASKRDTSIFVAFKMNNHRSQWPKQIVDPLMKKWFMTNPFSAELLIWTTTPWTLPANRAVAMNPEHEYVCVTYPEGMAPARYGPKDEMRPIIHGVIVAKHLVQKVMALKGISDYEVSESAKGQEFADGKCEYFHPLEPTKSQPVVLADYVTLEDGTGLVHTAPGHGKEDYATGKKYNLDIYNPVLADGRYDDSVPDFLKGKTIWDANQLVIDKLKETGALFHHQQFDHEYPHCWRCKKPVIFRATEQWFVKAAGDSQPDTTAETRPSGSVPPPLEPRNSKLETSSPLWKNAKKFVDTVDWIPAWGKNRIDGMLDTRPDWCISRQRSWGVPIPAFFDPQGRCLLTAKSVARVASYFRQHGADSWYTHSPAQLLGADTWTDTVVDPHGNVLSDFRFQTSDLTKSADILDVWFESGASHHAVLECTHPELGYPAQMYLEGSDQHRGWFQSSLLEASGYKSVPPFEQVLTHGFIVDEKGRKMSKSEGNDIKVNDALKQFGADVLRLWVCSVDYQNDIACGPNLLKTMGEAYRKIRNTMRYLLGNLYDFNPIEDAVDPHPHSIDQWMKNRVDQWAHAVYAAYERYEFHTVFKLIYEFCNVEISAVYAKAIKDRLYCELPDSPKRRASQTVCYRALMRLIELCAPVLVFTADEAWAAVRALPGCDELEESVHLATFSISDVADEAVDDVLSAVGDSDSEDAGDPLAALSMMAEKLADAQSAPAADKHWAVLMPLVEKGNKQLDELKRSVGLGNPLDAEAVIVVPTDVADDVRRHIADYGPELEDALGVGFHRIEHGELWDIKINDTRTLYPSCARSWKRRPDVGSDPAFPDLSARDAAVVRTLRAGTPPP
jgi:isoleucyl-tRNA synthetase